MKFVRDSKCWAGDEKLVLGLKHAGGSVVVAIQNNNGRIQLRLQLATLCLGCHCTITLKNGDALACVVLAKPP